jgi:hydrogenase-4 component B
MGIIFIGLGLSIVFTSFNLTYLAALAMLAAMYHVLNHAIFKSLLFMGAGAIIFRTHTGNMEKLGGLIKVMPWTAFLFLIGVLSISGLPFFNGFISEYLLILSLISSYQIHNILFTISIGFASVAFALTLGIVLAAFVRIFGISFLSKPRSEIIYKIKEIPNIMLLGIGIMATLCIVLGIVPSIGVILVTEGFSIQTPLQSTPLFSLESSILRINEDQNTSSISMPLVLTISCLVIVATIGFVYGIGGRTVLKRAETWNCGITDLTERMEYTVSSLSQPIFHVFRNFYKPKSSVHTTLYHRTNPYMKKTLNFENINKDIFEDFIYTPLIKMVSVSYDKMRIIQSGKVNLYLLNVLASIILLLVYVRLFQ